MTSRPDFDTPEFATDTLARVETVGRQWAVSRRVPNVPSGLVGRLSERGRERLGTYLSRLRGSDAGSDETGLEVLTDGGQRSFADTLEDIDQGGRTAADLRRQLDETDFGAVFNADLPDETRTSLLRAQRDGDLTASETATVARQLEGPDSSDVREAIRTLDATEQRNAYKLIGESGENGVQLIQNMGAETRETFFNLGTRNRFNDFDNFDEWRTAVTNADRSDVAEVSRYTERIDRAADRDNIDNLEGILDDTTPSTRQVAGESGEAASAIRYADEGAEVEIEPGNGESYDMAVTRDGQTEYVEVKTRAADEVDELYVIDQFGEMNSKYDDALDDEGLDVSENDRILEIRTRSEASELSSIQEEVTSAFETYDGDIEFEEIRLVANNGESISLSPLQ